MPPPLSAAREARVAAAAAAAAQGGVFAYTQHSKAGALPFSALLVVLMIAMAVVYFTQQMPSGKGQKPLRSTD